MTKKSKIGLMGILRSVLPRKNIPDSTEYYRGTVRIYSSASFNCNIYTSIPKDTRTYEAIEGNVIITVTP